MVVKMDLGLQLFLLVIFGLVGFICDKIIGINPYRIFSDLGAVIFILSLIHFIPLTSTEPEIVIKSLESFLKFFVESLPSMIIGDAAGTIVSRITGEKP